MRQITERVIKFTSNSLEVSEDYEKDTRIVFQGEGEIRSVEDTTNSDGTDRRKYKLEPLSVELKQLDSKERESEIAKPKLKSKSQELRSILFVYWGQEWQIKYPNFDAYYEAAMDKIIDNVRKELI